MQQAKEMLESGVPHPMAPALQLHLGRKYGIAHWVETGASSIVCMPLPTLSIDDYHLLGLRTIHILLKYHQRLVTHRQQLSIALPTQIGTHAKTCLDSKACGLSWATTCNQLSAMLFRSAEPITDAQLLQVLRQKQQDPMSSLGGMATPCLAGVIYACDQALSGGKDEQLKVSVISEICGALN
jgi:hypothetical protein